MTALSHRRSTNYALTLGVLAAPMLLAVTGGTAAAEPAGDTPHVEFTSATRPASDLAVARAVADPVTHDAGPADPVTFDPAMAVADALGAAELGGTAGGGVGTPASTPAVPLSPGRGPVTALVDGLVGPAGLLGGQGLVAGLVGGLLDGPLVQVGVDVSPQVNVGSIASTGDVSQTAVS